MLWPFHFLCINAVVQDTVCGDIKSNSYSAKIVFVLDILMEFTLRELRDLSHDIKKKNLFIYYCFYRKKCQ